MKIINAEAMVTVTIYDEEHEEHIRKEMTVEEMLDTYTDGCPPYLPTKQKQGKWIENPNAYECSVCGIIRAKGTTGKYNYCPECGARMGEQE